MRTRQFIQVTALVLSLSATSFYSPAAQAWSFNFGWWKSGGKGDESKSLNTPKALAASLTKGMKSDREKVTALFDWITENIAYDTHAYQTGELKLQSAQETLQKRKGVCDNFAVLFNEMARSAGLESTIVLGVTYVKTGNGTQSEHAWNKVVVDGKKWIVDTTWGSGHYDYASNQFTKRRNAQYLLAEPDFVSLSHYEVDKAGNFVPVSDLSFEQFKQLKDNTRKLVRIGFESSAVIRELKASREDLLPLAFEPAEPGIKVVRAPLDRTSAGLPANFAVSHPAGTRVFLSDGQQMFEFTRVHPEMSELNAGFARNKPLTLIYQSANASGGNGYFKLLEYAAR